MILLNLLKSGDLRHGEHPAAEQHSDLVGVDLIILGLAAMDGCHVEGMAQIDSVRERWRN